MSVSGYSRQPCLVWHLIRREHKILLYVKDYIGRNPIPLEIPLSRILFYEANTVQEDKWSKEL